jgi:hypothetical protein
MTEINEADRIALSVAMKAALARVAVLGDPEPTRRSTSIRLGDALPVSRSRNRAALFWPALFKTVEA